LWWRRVATAAAVGQLWAAEAVLGVGGKFGPPGPEVRFLTSTDGGRSWQPLGQLSGLGPLTASVQLRLTAGPAGLAWASVFDPQSCAMHGCATAQLYQSRDGGRSWATADLGMIPGSVCGRGGIVFSDAPDGTAWAATGQNGGACPSPFGLLYRHGPSGWQQLRPWQLTGISSLAAVGRDVAYAVDGSVLARTDDGGRRWTQLLPAAAPAGQVDALTAATAFAAQDASDAGAILHTTDGGRHWRRVADLPGVITQLDFPTASQGVAVTFQLGRKPLWQLWRSRNGGLTWDLAGRLLAQITSGNTGVYGPWMAADGHGVLLTIAGTIPWEKASGGTGPVRAWNTGDWGVHWTPGSLLPVVGDTLGAISFAPDSPGRWVGWLIHSTARGDGRVEATADTGRTLAPVPGSPAVDNVQLAGPATGFAWGIEATVHTSVPIMSLYRTRDDGRHWQHLRIVLPGPSDSTPLLDFTDADHGWLVIGTATWHTSDGGRTWHRGQA